jgi:S1-C subfamily serine protease
MHIKDWKSGGMDSREMVVRNAGKITFGDVFSQPGDSGGWIINAQGQLVGQQIAHRTANDGFLDLTVMTPIQEVFDDIERLTGGKLQLPN